MQLSIYDKVNTPHGPGVVMAVNYDEEKYDVELDVIIDEGGCPIMTSDGLYRTINGFEIDFIRVTYPKKVLMAI